MKQLKIIVLGGVCWGWDRAGDYYFKLMVAENFKNYGLLWERKFKNCPQIIQPVSGGGGGAGVWTRESQSPRSRPVHGAATQNWRLYLGSGTSGNCIKWFEKVLFINNTNQVLSKRMDVKTCCWKCNQRRFEWEALKSCIFWSVQKVQANSLSWGKPLSAVHVNELI